MTGTFFTQNRLNNLTLIKVLEEALEKIKKITDANIRKIMEKRENLKIINCAAKLNSLMFY